MKYSRLSIVLLTVLVFFISGIEAFAESDNLYFNNTSYAPGRILVKLKSVTERMRNGLGSGKGVSRTYISSIDNLNRKYGIDSMRYLFDDADELRYSSSSYMSDRHGLDRIFIFDVPSGADIPKLAAEYSQNPMVEYAEPDYIGFGGAVVIPNDPRFPDQWSLNNTGQTGGKNDADIDAPEAWEITTGDNDIIVAILDTGIDLQHPDLKSKIKVIDDEKCDFVNSDEDPSDDHGHGTSVAGVVGAVSDNRIGIAGVCWKCTLLPVKVLNSENWGYVSWWAQGIRFAVKHNANIINLSLGTEIFSRPLRDAVDFAYDSGILVVSITHNFGNSVTYYPGGFDNVIGVGATEMNDRRWANSCFGKHIDVVAPGVSILTTHMGGGYNFWTGTSHAAPHVSGVAVLLLSVNPSLTPAQIYRIFQETSEDKVGPPQEDTQGWDQYYGYGRINAHRALKFIGDMFTITATAGEHGKIIPEGAILVNKGESKEFNIIPDENYHVLDVIVNGTSVGAVTRYEFSGVNENNTIYAEFEIDTHIVTATAGSNGIITPSGEITVPHGSSLKFTITPDANCHIADVKVDGKSIGAVAEHTISNITADRAIEAEFEINTYTITASAGDNGKIEPSGEVVVEHGSDAEFAMTPDEHYHILDVEVDGQSIGAESEYKFNAVAEDHTISVTFEIDKYTITASAGENGSIDPAGEVIVDYGSEKTFAINPDENYHVADVKVDGASVGAVSEYTFSSIDADHTIDAAFAIDTNTITATAGEHGKIEPEGEVTVDFGADQKFVITPDENYHVADVKVDGNSVGAVTEYTFEDVSVSHTIEATFEIDAFTITATAGEHGKIEPSGVIGVSYGAEQKFTITPDENYHIADVMVDGVSKGAVTEHTFSEVISDHTIEATFEINTYTITATAGENGSIDPSGEVTVAHGADQEFKISPDENYIIADVEVDGASVGALDAYTFTGVTADHTISASFAVCIKGDVNGNGEVRSNDAIMALQIVVGLMTPTPQQECSADMNGDGKVGVDDAILILREAVGLSAPEAVVAGSRDVTITTDEVYGEAGACVIVPIKVDRADILAGGDIQISYDSDVLRAVDVSVESGIMMAKNITEPGIVRIAFASDDNLNSGTLASIEFEVLTDDISPLTFRRTSLYGTDALLLDSKGIGKRFISWFVRPDHSALLQNYPNPFNPETWIPYHLAEDSQVSVSIYNPVGQMVRHLELGFKKAGLYVTRDRSAYWDGRNDVGERVSSGVYFYVIQAGKYSEMKKMVIIQ